MNCHPIVRYKNKLDGSFNHGDFLLLDPQNNRDGVVNKIILSRNVNIAINVGLPFKILVVIRRLTVDKKYMWSQNYRARYTHYNRIT